MKERKKARKSLCLCARVYAFAREYLYLCVFVRLCCVQMYSWFCTLVATSILGRVFLEISITCVCLCVCVCVSVVRVCVPLSLSLCLFLAGPRWLARFLFLAFCLRV